MSSRIYPAIRALHLYVGLFLSPFVIVFAVSVIFLVHPRTPDGETPGEKRTVANLPAGAELERLKGREQAVAAHAVLDHIGVRGEIGFIRQFPKERRFVMPVSVPGRETTVDLNFATRTATIAVRNTGSWDAMVYLHRMPGPHNVALRGNSTFMAIWGWLADATVYLLMFLSISGVYLWAVLRSERRIGITLLAAGAASFGGLVYALIR